MSLARPNMTRGTFTDDRPPQWARLMTLAVAAVSGLVAFVRAVVVLTKAWGKLIMQV